MDAIMWLVENGVALEGPDFVEKNTLQFACCRAKSTELVEYLLTYPSITFFDNATVEEAIDIAKSNNQPHFEGVIRDAIMQKDAQNGAVPPSEQVDGTESPSSSDEVAIVVPADDTYDSSLHSSSSDDEE